MYENVGEKIKRLAKLFAILGFVSAAVFFVFMCILDGVLDADGLLVIIGLFVAAFDCILAWLGQILLYGYGELIENSLITAVNVTDLYKYIKNERNMSFGGGAGAGTSNGPAQVNNPYNSGYVNNAGSTDSVIMRWKQNGLISDSEYNDLMQNLRRGITKAQLDQVDAQLSSLKSRANKGLLSQSDYNSQKRASLNFIKN